MKNFESDIEKIAKLAEKRRNENFDFRAYLKVQDSKRIDRIVHQLDKEISSQINCQECGNCCQSLRPGVTESEIDILSQKKGLSNEDFISQFFKKDNYEDIYYLKDTPCIFLKDNSCTIYNDRPKVCKSFPHTHKRNFASRLLDVIDNYAICPIVFNIFEELKIKLSYRR
jgi:Fe-S-cluster containining protein